MAGRSGTRALASSTRAISPPASLRKRKRSTTISPSGIEISRLTASPSITTGSRFRGSNPDDVRIFSWNVNGITPLLGAHLQKPITSFFKASPNGDQGKNDEESPLGAFLRRHGFPQVLCLQEVMINPKDERTKRAVTMAANEGSTIPSDSGSDSDTPTGFRSDVSPAASSEGSNPGYQAFFNLPRDKYNARGFGGRLYGVCTLVRNDFWRAYGIRCRPVEWDVEGRVLLMETSLELSPRPVSSPIKGASRIVKDSPTCKLAILNVYAVNGTDNPYKSPESGTIMGTRHEHKRRFHAALLKDCLALQREGSQFVLAGDFNVSRTPVDSHPYLRTKPEEHVLNRADFNDKFFTGSDGLRAVDSFRWLHGHSQRKFTYYPRGKPWGAGCDRVDLIILSRGLVERSSEAGETSQEEEQQRCQKILKEADMLDNEEERGPSDHVPLWVTLDGSRIRLQSAQ
ncbi:MAG: hypothetical protein M1817_002383 [Caeruleum heppii]|nr:MAG: hypothetical protein M1817_002383 [Caeruleum heppii]